MHKIKYLNTLYTKYTIHYTLHTIHYTLYTLHLYTITLHYTTQIKLHYTTPHYTTLGCTTLYYPTLQYTTLIAPPQFNCNSLHHNYNSTTTTTTAALHQTTSSSCEWCDRPGDHCNHCNQPLQKNTTPTTFQSISGFALPSVIHNDQALL